MPRSRPRGRLATSLIAVPMVIAALVLPMQAATAASPMPQQAQAPQAPQAAASDIPSVECGTLVAGGSCSFDYSDYPNGVEVQLPGQVTALTVLVSGASGGPATDHAAGGGQGSMVIATFDATGQDSLTIQLGEASPGQTAGSGWSSGGPGGSAAGIYNDGGGGGGSSAIGWTADWPKTPLIVAGGGGGGGGNITSNGVNGPGGAGGVGGNPAGDGADAGLARAGDGAGGKGGGSTVADGDAGENGAGGVITRIASAGGGGGGGYPNGGGRGSAGRIGQCKFAKCPPDGQPGPGGGGGGGSSYVKEGLSTQVEYGYAGLGDGSVTLIAGSPITMGCSGSEGTLAIPSDVVAYGFIASGGSGSRGHNTSGSEGHGATVSGVVDVAYTTALNYWVGCSPYDGGWGYTLGGSGGHAPATDAKDGAPGGGSTMVMDAEGNPLFAAGGGGGSGGDTDCVPDTDDCAYRGGKGGNGGGINGTPMRFDGEGGGGWSDLGGEGGCGGCRGTSSDPNPNGGNGGAGSGSGLVGGGGGGGGGAGYPRAGAGGSGSPLVAAGAGGAGDSFLAAQIDGGIGTNTDAESGWIMLIPIQRAETTLTVAKSVVGTGVEYAHGPFTMTVDCTFDQQPLFSATIQLGVDDQHSFDALRIGASCTVTETDSGGATTAAPPQTLTLKPGGNLVTMTNEFGSVSASVALFSTIQTPSEEPNPGVELALGTVRVAISCTFEGAPIALPTGGTLRFAGDDSWGPDGVSQQFSGLPLGAQCRLGEIPGSLATTTEYWVNGTAVGSEGVAFTVGSTETAVEILDTYQLAPLQVTLAADGTPPAGETYAGTVTCDFGGLPVSLPENPLPFSLAVGVTTEVPDLPVGAQCTIVETDRGGATSVQYSPSDTATIGPADAPAAITVTNVYPVIPPDPGGAAVNAADAATTASVDITSTTTGDAAAYANASTTVHVTDCSFGGIPLDVDKTFEFAPLGGEAMITGLPIGAVCEASQTDAGGASSSQYAVSNGDPSATGADAATFTVNAPVAGTPTTVAITNTFDLAGLDVRVDVAGAAAWAADADYVVAASCSFNDKPLTRLGPGGVATLTFSPQGVLRPSAAAEALKALPIGAECTAEEPETSGASTVRFDPAGSSPGRSAPVRVALGSTLTITNTFDASGYRVAASVSGNDAAAHADDLFFYEQSCRFNGKPLHPQTTPAWQTVVSLAGGQSYEFTGLPVGATCEVVEFDTSNATRVLPASTQEVVLGVDDAALAFENVFDVAEVVVTQTVEGDGVPVYGQGRSFDEVISCHYPDAPHTGIPLPHRGHITLSPPENSTAIFTAPLGAVCAIDQPDAQMATFLDLTGSIEVTAGANALSATNVYDLGTAVIDKSVAGDAPADATFDFGVSCRFGDEEIAVATPADGAFGLRADRSIEIRALSGASCTVTEKDSRGASTVTVSQDGNTATTSAATVELCWCAAVTASFANHFGPSILPATGAPSLGLAVGVAMLLLGVGAVVLFFAWRRRPAG